MLNLLIPHEKNLTFKGMTGKKGYCTVLNCRGGLELYGEGGGFSSTIYNSEGLKINWDYRSAEI